MEDDDGTVQSQYFLIPPILLPGLEYSYVLCVASGTYMPAERRPAVISAEVSKPVIVDVSLRPSQQCERQFFTLMTGRISVSRNTGSSVVISHNLTRSRLLCLMGVGAHRDRKHESARDGGRKHLLTGQYLMHDLNMVLHMS